MKKNNSEPLWISRYVDQVVRPVHMLCSLSFIFGSSAVQLHFRIIPYI